MPNSWSVTPLTFQFPEAMQHNFFLQCPQNQHNTHHAENIIKVFEKYQSILEIIKNLKLTETFKIPKAKISDINNLLKSINIKKATGRDTIL